MGVQNLWSLLKPTSKPIRIETLSGQRLAVDASIWLHQFLKAMRDSKGNPLQSAHIVGFLRRICKLLFHGIKPVFVFDGGVPELKRATIASRRVKRQKAQESLEKTAQRVLDAQLKLQALQSIEGSHHIDLPSIPVREVVDDEYHLPDTYVRPKSILDPRLATEGELMDFISSQSSNIDFSKVDINSTDFQSLSAELQHEIILTLKNQSRLPNQRRVQQMLESSTSAIDFSTAQIKNMIHRATLTDRYYHLNKGGALQKRVAGSRQRDFVLIKKDGGVGGWELGNGAAAIKVVDGLEGLVGFNSKKKPNGSTKSTKSFENGLKLKDYALEEKYDDSVVGDFVDNFVDDSIVGDFVDDFVDDSVPFREILEKFKLLQDRKVIQDSIADKLNQHNGLEKYLDEDSAGGESEHSKWLKRWSNRVPQSFKIAYPTFDKIISLDILEKSFLALKELIKILERRVQQSGHDYDLFYLEFVQDALIEKTKLVVVMDGSDLSDDSDQDEVFEIIDQPCSVRATYEVDDHALKAHDYSAMKGSIPFQLFDDDSCSDDETESKIKCKESDKMDTSPQISHANNKDTNLDAPKESSEVNTNYYVIPQDNITSKFSTTIHTSPNANQPYFDDGINSTNLSIDLIEKKADTHVTCSSQVKKLVTPCIESCQPFEDSENIIKCRISTESIFSKQDEGPISMPMPEEFDLKNDFERTSLPVLCDDEPFSDDNASNCSGLSFEEIRAKNVMEQDVKNIDVPGLDMAEVIGYFKDLDTTNIADSIDKTQTELINLYEQQRRDMRDMGDVTITMVKETQELLKLFGIPWIVAPMEAESQCAFLLLHKLVDGIITDDSDVFLFGGSSVYKNFFDSKQYVEKFEMSSIAELGLEREQLIQLAYLLGSDYSVGVKGLGPVSGVEIVNSWSSSDLSGLKAWKEWVFDLKNNVASKDDEDTRKKLRNKCRKVDLAETFPNAHIFDAYIRPTVNESKQEFTWGNPQLELLKAFLTFKLGWPEEKIDPILIPVIKEMFQKRNERQPTMKDFFPNIPTLHKSKRVQNATRGGRKKSRRL